MRSKCETPPSKKPNISHKVRKLKSPTSAQVKQLLKRLLREKTLATDSISRELRMHCLGQGLVKQTRSENGAGDFFVPTELTKQALRRMQCDADLENIFAAQHQTLQRLQVDEAKPGKVRTKPSLITINKAESPLQLLAKRKCKGGGASLTASQVEAGERLRRDFEKSHMAPNLSMNWEKLGKDSTVGKQRTSIKNAKEIETDNRLDAQDRFNKAVIALGQELSRPLVDFCCYLIGLEKLEKAHGWPARSGKLVISIGLSQLARHYGYEEVAIGPQHSHIRHWGAEGYSPNFAE